MELNWEKLLCSNRLHKQKRMVINDKRNGQDLVRSAFGQDYSRVVFSPPFRRLSKKTQVHPFANIDFIHNRLTHSLEVASLGQTFGLSLAELMSRKKVLPSAVSPIDIANIIEAASALEPFFWSAPRSQAEIDFLVEADGMVVPVEVKAERNLKAKLLQVFRQKFQPELSVRTSLAEYEVQESLLNLPLYAIGAFRSLHSSLIGKER